jgi:hypothetical protein
MLTFLERLAYGFWDLIRRAVALLIPFLSSARTLRGWGRGLRWTLTILLLVGILGGLTWINFHFGLDVLLPRAPIVFGIRLANFWLPILALLLYALLWLGWWLWKLLGPESEVIEFADIDEAWEEAVHALNLASIDVREAPLFLVLGRPSGPEQALLDGAQLQLKVSHAPNRPTAPLHVYANRDGIYVTCAGASLLGQQAAILAGEADAALEGIADGAYGTPAADAFKTLQPQGQLLNVQAVLARAREQGRGADQLTEEEKLEIKRLIARDEAEHAQRPRQPRPLLLKNTEEVARLNARLKYLCRVIVRDRHPYCPVNGILLLIPFEANDTREDADQMGMICQQDLTTARQTLQVNCPLFALVCDLEKAQGFQDFLERFPPDQRQRRVGQRFPLAPDLRDNEDLLEVIDRSVQWISSSLFPTWIYRLFRVERDGREEFAPIVTGNVHLYQMLGQMRERQKRLSGLVVRSLTTSGHDEPWLFGGCYVAATGADSANEQAFIAGVFRRLTDNQNYVSWTSQATEEEANYHRWTNYGYGAIVVGGLVLLGMLYYAIVYLV